MIFERTLIFLCIHQILSTTGWLSTYIDMLLIKKIQIIQAQCWHKHVKPRRLCAYLCIYIYAYVHIYIYVKCTCVYIYSYISAYVYYMQN